MPEMLDVGVPPDVFEGFKTYLRKKHPKYKLDLLQEPKKIFNHYLSFVEKVLAPNYGLHNLKLILTKSPLPTILFCQKIPNTNILWIPYKQYYFHNQIPITLRDDFPSLASYLKRIIDENKPLIDSFLTALSPKDDDCDKEWTYIDAWVHVLSITADYAYKGDPKEWKTVHAHNFLKNTRHGIKEQLKIPSYIYGSALSYILRAKLVGTPIDAFFTEIGKQLTPVCHIYTPPRGVEFLFPDLSTEKNASVNLTKIDEFNRTTNEYLKKVHSRVKTTARTLLIVKNLLQ